MSSRVIAGSAKGHRLKLVPGEGTRPVMDRVKEALFNIIGAEIVDTTFLDLFAGTGAIGIEALSRGAAEALFLEIDRLALRTIRENLESTRLGDGAEVRMMDALGLLNQVPEQTYDFIYVAPPQYKGIWQKVLEALDENPAWLGANTVVIVQIDPREQEDVLFRHLREYDQRRYGRTLLWFFEAIEEDDDDDE